MEHHFWSLWRSQSAFAGAVRLVLRPFSWPFALGSWLKNKLYDYKILRASSLGKRIVSIGNITVGGTGKTPFLIWLAKALEERECSFAVLTRGYRSKAEKQGVQARADNLDEVGDEAALLFKQLKRPLIFVGKDRLRSLRDAVELGVSTILLDDGLQKRAIGRSCDIVLLDSQEPFGHNAFLPSGFLRDQVSSLRRADFIVVREGQSVKFLRNFTEAPIIYTKATYEIALPKGTPVALFAGIAAPERFAEAMKECGFPLVYTKWLEDHASLSLSLLEKIWREAEQRGAKSLVCTEKDEVKIPVGINIPIAVLRMKIEPTEGQQLLDKILT